MGQAHWAVGVDLGGTKVKVAAVDAAGMILRVIQQPTDVAGGPERITADIVAMVRQVAEPGPPSGCAGVGVGVAGQIALDTGVIRFAPNLKWRDVPFRERLRAALGLPVFITNDVRAATWGEWLHGAGQGVDDLICLFIGTGVGGGVVSGGRMLTGCTNTAGELGHMTVAIDGPRCTCGNRGCLEALAGGWAIARRAREAVREAPGAARAFLNAAGLKEPWDPGDLTAKAVAQASQAGDPLARVIVDEVARALTAGAVGLVNAFNPCRLILGGGVINGFPELLGRVEAGVRQAALNTATEGLQVMAGTLKNDAGVVGAAALALRSPAP
jgi:glucokinase